MWSQNGVVCTAPNPPHSPCFCSSPTCTGPEKPQQSPLSSAPLSLYWGEQVLQISLQHQEVYKLFLQGKRWGLPKQITNTRSEVATLGQRCNAPVIHSFLCEVPIFLAPQKYKLYKLSSKGSAQERGSPTDLQPEDSKLNKQTHPARLDTLLTGRLGRYLSPEPPSLYRGVPSVTHGWTKQIFQ